MVSEWPGSIEWSRASIEATRVDMIPGRVTVVTALTCDTYLRHLLAALACDTCFRHLLATLTSDICLRHLLAILACNTCLLATLA